MNPQPGNLFIRMNPSRSVFFYDQSQNPQMFKTDLAVGNVAFYPLSDQFLLSNAGFKRDGLSSFARNDFYITKTFDRYYFAGIEIKFAHDLQNVYEILKNEKLTITI